MFNSFFILLRAALNSQEGVLLLRPDFCQNKYPPLGNWYRKAATNFMLYERSKATHCEACCLQKFNYSLLQNDPNLYLKTYSILKLYYFLQRGGLVIENAILGGAHFPFYRQFMVTIPDGHQMLVAKDNTINEKNLNMEYHPPPQKLKSSFNFISTRLAGYAGACPPAHPATFVTNILRGKFKHLLVMF